MHATRSARPGAFCQGSGRLSETARDAERGRNPGRESRPRADGQSPALAPIPDVRPFEQAPSRACQKVGFRCEAESLVDGSPVLFGEGLTLLLSEAAGLAEDLSSQRMVRRPSLSGSTNQR
jgi:hypothetical protein